MNNKHIPTKMRGSGVSTITLGRAEDYNALIAELPMTVTGRVARRVPCRQVPEEALWRRSSG